MIIFNILAVVFVFTSFASTLGICWCAGIPAESSLGSLMMGVLCILLDATYRIQQPNGHWISPLGGGSVFFLPVWLIGIFWTIGGLVSSVTNPATMHGLGLVITALVVLLGALGLTAFQMARSDGEDPWERIPTVFS